MLSANSLYVLCDNYSERDWANYKREIQRTLIPLFHSEGILCLYSLLVFSLLALHPSNGFHSL